MVDFRAELAALVAAYDEHGGKWPSHHEEALWQAVDHARDVLAQPGPETPTDKELLEMMPQPFRDDLACVSRIAAHGAGPDIKPGLFRVTLNTGALDYARAVLARWGAAAPAADGEVAELAAWLTKEMPPGTYIGDPTWWASRIAGRAHILMKRQALRPISVSERLPGPEDCVPHPRTKRGNWCWGFERCEVPLTRPALWMLMCMEVVEMEASHWLPAHALPLPEVE